MGSVFRSEYGFGWVWEAAPNGVAMVPILGPGLSGSWLWPFEAMAGREMGSVIMSFCWSSRWVGGS